MIKSEADGLELVLNLLRKQGCFRVMESGVYSNFGDTGLAHRFLDSLVLLGRIKLLSPPGTWGQYEIYSDGKTHNR